MDVGIVGVGNVGATLAYCFLHSGKINKIIITDINRSKLHAVFLDLQDAAYIQKKCLIEGSEEMMMNCSYIIITAGRPQKPEEERKALFNDNYSVVLHEMGLLSRYRGKVILATNPVDAITALMKQKYPYLNIISTGTRIDQIRAKIIEKEAVIKGTHDGDQMVEINGEKDWYLTEKVRWKAKEIIYGKGYTCYGIAEVIREIVENGNQE